MQDGGGLGAQVLAPETRGGYNAMAVTILDQTMKPKKTEHTSATGKKFYGTPAEFYLYNNLPYARWTLADRREVLVNAFDEPMWQRGPGLPPSVMDPHARVTGILWVDRIYGDARRHHEKRCAAKTWLDDFRNGILILLCHRLLRNAIFPK
jgi:hypothetical protein